MTNKLEVGSEAPDFKLLDSSGNLVSLSDYAGKKIVLYFYPAALTPGCTIEAIDFSDALADFMAAGYQIVGISPDSVERLKKFKDKENLKITLLSDESKQTLEAYGVWGQRTIFGKSVTGVIRTTFIINVAEDGTGKVELANYHVKAKGHVARIRCEAGID